MVDTHNDDALASLQREADVFRKSLVEKGFVDDGKELRRSVEWQHGGETHSAIVAVRITKRFPFAPPHVAIVKCGELEPTFHRETNGDLCLWTTEHSLGDAPWQNTDTFIAKISGWFEATENGWPDDNDADLERYLESNMGTILIYDGADIQSGKFYRTRETTNSVVQIREQLPWAPSFGHKKQKGLRRREKNLCFVINAGAVSYPIRNWDNLVRLTGRDFTDILKLIQVGSVKYMLVQYSRGNREAVVALGVNKRGELVSYESADSSVQTRTLRSGTDASLYAKKKVIVFGGGAIGSQIVGLLFRSGVKNITIVDPERLRPGNVIRHLAGDASVGQYKVIAIKNELASLGLGVDDIKLSAERVNDPDTLLDLAKDHTLIVDATADNRASNLLWWASKTLDIPMVVAVLQREGGIARVDRFPLWGGERHLPAVPYTPGSVDAYEQGCGSPVSMTPPASAAKVAALAAIVILDQLKMIPRNPADPATIMEVIIPQADSPYDRVGLLTSESVEIE